LISSGAVAGDESCTMAFSCCISPFYPMPSQHKYFRTKTKKYLQESVARIAILDASISPLQRVPKNVDSNVTICASEVHSIIVRPNLQLAQSVAALQEDGVPLPDGLEAIAHENEDKRISNKSMYIL
jgi:hypothetical protein